MSDTVEIFEMGPRDGLQNESRMIATKDKIALVDALSLVGFHKIEMASFVSPKWVPQMADSADVMAGIIRADGVLYTALTPNIKGLERALAAGADEVAIFGSASEGFSKANINATIAESLERFVPLVAEALKAGVPVRGYVSCVTDCPYDGPTPPQNVTRVAKALMDMGCYEISLGDTLGQATPESITTMLQDVLSKVPAAQLAGHYHDTSGRALQNIEASLALGLRVFDSSVGGLGGCPYAPGAKGNVATEAVVELLDTLGYTTGLDHDLLAKAAAFAKTLRSAT